jgi:hypothetical protein
LAAASWARNGAVRYKPRQEEQLVLLEQRARYRARIKKDRVRNGH